MAKVSEGPELDLAVAEACKLNATIYYNHDLSKNVCLLLPDEKAFQPSTDLNDAFYAAEKVGLFDEWNIGKFSNPPRSGWGIEGDDSLDCNLYDTPALAICAAILKVKK